MLPPFPYHSQETERTISLMSKYRRGRINEEMQKELTQILRRVKDPRVSDAFVSITAADCTPDLKYAKIYYSVMSGDAKEVAKGLKAAAGFIRRELANTLNLRMTPELTFLPDSSISYGAHIAAVLNTLQISPEEETDETDGNDND